MRAEVTRIVVLLAGGAVMAGALLFSMWVAGAGVAAGSLLGMPVAVVQTGGSQPTPPGDTSSAGPSSAPAASPSPMPSLPQAPLPSPTVTQPEGPIGTPVPATAPPPPRDEADGCPRPPSNIRLAPVLAHGDERRKIVALTFDDGFNEANTRKILGILKRYHVNATFFPTGQAIAQSPDVWRDIVTAGFPIGDHTYSHPTMSDLCYAAQLSEIQRQAKVVRSKLGIRVQPYMRPPYEAWNRTTRIAVTAADQRAMVIWNIDTKDWAGSTVATIQRRALHGQDGAIVLMHTTVENTATALPEIIRGYRARGFRFVTIGQMLGLDGPVPYL
jgi:peptidoglycan/xylan/chitin deacetylase (PgdA/CDA1 family)